MAADFRYGRPSFFTTHIMTRKRNGHIVSSACVGRRFEERNAPLGCENLLERLHCPAEHRTCIAMHSPNPVDLPWHLWNSGTQPEGRQIAGDVLICSSY